MDNKIKLRYTGTTDGDLKQIITNLSTNLKVDNLLPDMLAGDFLPAGRTIRYGAFSSKIPPNCSVLPITAEKYSNDISNMVKVYSKTTGFGVNLSNLPYGSNINPVKSILNIHENIEKIKCKDGREHGNSALLNSCHPDALEFAKLKLTHPEMNRFCNNIILDNKFMEEKNKSKEASDLFDEFIKTSWQIGEPGYYFIDYVKDNVYKNWKYVDKFNTDSLCSVPCGEQFMFPYETCNLGAINVSNFVKSGEIDVSGLTHASKSLMKLLTIVLGNIDNPISEMADMSNKIKRVGVGIMGWANLLKMLNLKYKVNADVHNLAVKVMKAIDSGIGGYSQMATPFVNESSATPSCNYREKYKLATVTCLQPTGGISQLCSILVNSSGKKKREISSSIEPMFEDALDIEYQDHIKMQAMFQGLIHQSIAKTINMKNSATVDDVRGAIELAHHLGCHGITVYRTGCRKFQPIKCESCADGVCVI